MAPWTYACKVEAIEKEDVFRFDHADKTYAVYRCNDDTFHCTDGLCTHELVHLAEGLVMDDIIECPKHNGQFNLRTGKAIRAPACKDLTVYPVRVENGRVLVGLPVGETPSDQRN